MTFDIKIEKCAEGQGPSAVLYRLMEEIRDWGKISEETVELWNSLKTKHIEIGQEERFDYIVNALELECPSKTLKSMYDSGLLAFCLPLCFPLKKPRQRRELERIIQEFDLCQRDLRLRVKVFFFPLDVEGIRETLELANFDPDTIRSIVVAVQNAKTESKSWCVIGKTPKSTD